ncbi:ABC transporter permease [Kibdelosporangium persicum]|uniref:Transport permease protein n=1 Tax=Kibdelosporangium persicum TaxID=2698649 RepID=A0ABX2F4B3_9PSEU|nr:ABC transporter permease [Kibdelosporangium persicum]NRN66173.1 ABC transporter permease [Kibdelosporangium persicum]
MTTISPSRALRHSMLMAGRTAAKSVKNPAVLVELVIQPLVMLVLFSLVLGGAISGGDSDAYTRQLVPGLMVYSALLVSVGTGVALSTDITKGVFDRFRSMPIARSAPLVGTVVGDLFRYTACIVLTLGFGYLFGFRVTTGVVPMLLDLVLMIGFSFSLCWISVWVGMLAGKPETVQGYLFILIMPISFGSTIFVQSSTLPGWLAAWTDINPVSLLSEVNRGLLTGGPVGGPLLGALAWMAGFVVVFYPLAMAAYKRRMR